MNKTLDEILEWFQYRTAELGFPMNQESHTDQLDKAKHAIIPHIKGKMPKHKNTDAGHTAKSIEGGWMASGYNKCLDEVNKILNEMEK